MNNVLKNTEGILNKPVVVSMGLVVLYVILIIGLGLLFNATDSSENNWIATLTADVLIGGLCLFVIVKNSNLNIHNAVLPSNVSKWSKPAKIILSAAIFAIVWMLGVASSALGQSSGSETYFILQTPVSPMYLTLSLIAAPLCEEGLFRGIVFDKLSKTKAGVIGAAVVSAFIFAVLHGSQTGILSYFALGLFLCFVYVLFGNLLSAMLFHCCYNGLMVVFNGLEIEASFSLLPIVACASLVLIIGFLLVFRKTRFHEVAEGKSAFEFQRKERSKRPTKGSKKPRASK